MAHTPSDRLRRLYGGRGKLSIGRNSAMQIDCFIVGAGMVDFTIGERRRDLDYTTETYWFLY